MKDTFHNLAEEKRERIVRAALREFAVSGYEKATLDAVVQGAGISKGGLYEYITSKDDLFRYLLEYSYSAMYDFIISDDGALNCHRIRLSGPGISHERLWTIICPIRS